MAIVIPGVTVCPLCRRAIDGPEDFIGFPHFIEDEEDPLWIYSDAAFHKSCFDTWSRKEEFLGRLRGFEGYRRDG